LTRAITGNLLKKSIRSIIADFSAFEQRINRTSTKLLSLQWKTFPAGRFYKEMG
jgi:hypothetical protein